jgi:taurine dioxygenase
VQIEFEPLSYALGAEVRGVDIAAGVSDVQLAEIRAGFLRHGVLLFRRQRISREQHIAFSARFGELDRHDSVPRDRIPGYPELLAVTNDPQAVGVPSDSKYTGQTWHSDLSFTLEPAMGSLLRGVRVPPVGGDTMFANMTLAYEQLSPGMQRLVAGLTGVHATARKMSAEREAEARKLNPPVAQPVVRVHPETGRKSLYIGEKVERFVELTQAESRPIIDYLCRHASQPQLVYRHRWQADDILMWDNRCTNHLALGDYDDNEVRHLERTTIKGTPSGYALP